MIAFGIDIGGSGIKGAAVDLGTGELVDRRRRVDTPSPSQPEAMIAAVAQIVRFHAWTGPVGVTVPGVVVDGKVLTAVNIDKGWIGFDAQKCMSEMLGVQVSVLNDADAAGLAEMQYGSHGTERGVVLLLTFGTGIGSALINDGVLVPNTEFGHLEFKGMVAEKYASARLVKRDHLDIERWAGRVSEFLQYLELILSPKKIVFGGGISRRFEEFEELLDTRAPVVPARLRNNAGIVGAAIMAASKEHK
ncbi:MAG: ROK family protein [Acidimicrobiia bacterium]|nr:MAG: ROK family protein [Acidimicrobiia bacterium]